MSVDLITNLSNIEGIWVPTTNSAPVSYSSSGHQECYEVENRSFWFSLRNQVIYRVLQRYSPPGTLFDVGGGNGVVSSFLQNQGIDVVLVEPGRHGVDNAKKRGVNQIICGRFQDLEITEQLLPAIGLFDVVEHIEDDAAFLQSVADRMSVGGRLYITVPAYQFLWSDHDERAGHFRRYTSESLGRVVKNAGFSIDFASYFFSPLPPFILLGRVIKEKVLKLRERNHRTQKQAEHGNQLAGALFGMLCRFDLTLLSRGMPLAFGSSCILVATKTAARSSSVSSAIPATAGAHRDNNNRIEQLARMRQESPH
jgi:SAM-dependent methyltransferase